MTLKQRIQAALNGRTGSEWTDLIRLFEKDREAFYLIACGEIDEPFKDLGALAHKIRSAINDSYEIEKDGSTAQILSAHGTLIPVPTELVAEIRAFLRTVDGKTSSELAGKDYVGTAVSEAEMRFKLGERDSWVTDHARIELRQTARPFVLRLHEEEISHLAFQPAYVTYGLLNCARKVVLSPTSVFKGLARGDDCPSDLKQGWAFCGKPRQAFDNEGRAVAVPPGMVYLVYADENRFVFDWDWVKENQGEPGYPFDWHIRFGNLHQFSGDAILELPKNLQPGHFDASEACYSSRGDCIFCYMTDELSHAVRINADLTVFKSLDRDDYTGFKIKNVRRILEVDKTIQITDAPGLTVSVGSVLLATLKRHPEGNVQVYNVLIHALYKTGEPPKVRVPASTYLIEA